MPIFRAKLKNPASGFAFRGQPLRDSTVPLNWDTVERTVDLGKPDWSASAGLDSPGLCLWRLMIV
jgi:hypothetical protein